MTESLYCIEFPLPHPSHHPVPSKVLLLCTVYFWVCTGYFWVTMSEYLLLVSLNQFWLKFIISYFAKFADIRTYRKKNVTSKDSFCTYSGNIKITYPIWLTVLIYIKIEYVFVEKYFPTFGINEVDREGKLWMNLWLRSVVVHVGLFPKSMTPHCYGSLPKSPGPF